MDRLQRLSEFWSWLPAFRAVAETAHLPSAARSLCVSPSALSRSIHLLERKVGLPLFRRAGRRLELSPEGQAFLDALRDAMRRVDDGLAMATNSVDSGPIHVSTAGALSYVVLPAAMRLRAALPRLTFHLHQHPPDAVNALLLRGRLDLAFLPNPHPEERLSIREVGLASNGIYCGRGHPLFRARRLTLERLLSHAFAAPVAEAAGPQADNWPPGLPRRVEIHIAQLRLAVDCCAQGHALAVLPDVAACAYPDRAALRRLAFDLIPPTRCFAVRRPQRDRVGAVERLVEEVRAALAAAQRDTSRRRRR